MRTLYLVIKTPFSSIYIPYICQQTSSITWMDTPFFNKKRALNIPKNMFRTPLHRIIVFTNLTIMEFANLQIFVRYHSSLSCFLQFPLSTSLAPRHSIYAPKSTKKRALNLLCRFKTLSFIDYFFLQKTE